MKTAEHRPGLQLFPAARWYSRLLPPALVLAVLVTLAGIEAGLGPVGVAVLLAGVVGVPGVIYKGTKAAFRRRGIPDSRRTALVAALMLAAVVVCFLLPVPAPVPETVTGLLIGNVALVFFRRWLDVSAHVSVLTFAVLWTTATYGAGWAWLWMLSPLMILSRVSLGEHTRHEALSGAALGLATFGCFLAILAQH
ncbi:hypothetical protein GD627_12010 [Arthrobacter yangruifuii]|uniref:Phosphoesterase n=1 Tax=Arthrobacter yangruifuii TaxID=2606616 RepID=A0A5N6MGM0_9MICC|nr:hypothetical protein [Arthrobacter yangruifuii]KAD3515028.1 hypothetical protein GD627_12010 [Arthrobacter yangruifuii]